MKTIQYGKLDFPTGVDATLLQKELVASQGKSFGLSIAANDYVVLFLDDADNETAVRAICIAHFAKTLQQRIDDLATFQTDEFFVNGDKTKRFLLEIFYRVDQRLRILEAAPAITKLQFFNGIKSIYKNI